MRVPSTRPILTALTLLLGLLTLTACGCGPFGLDYCRGYQGGGHHGGEGRRGGYVGGGGGWGR